VILEMMQAVLSIGHSFKMDHSGPAKPVLP